MKIRGIAWFSGGISHPFAIGVVIYQNEINELRALIGSGWGYSPVKDAELIMKEGHKLNVPAAIQIIKKHGGWSQPLTEDELERYGF